MPLLNSPVVVRQTAGVLTATFALMSLLLTIIFAIEGDWAGIPPTLAVIGLVHLALGVGAILVMAIFFGNRMAMRFRLDKHGATSEIIEKKAEKASRLAVLFGLATGNFTVAGAGMLARSGARSFVSWHRVLSFRFDERRHTIYLMGRWRVKAALFCTPEIYPDAKGAVEKLCSPK